VSLPIITSRLVLRRFAEDDNSALRDLLAHWSFAEATPEIEPTEKGVTAYIEMQNAFQAFEQNKCFDLAIERQVDRKLVGLITLVCRAHKQGQIGYALGIGYRGQGYATEAAHGLVSYAFASLNLHRIHADADSGNPASWNVMERLGMKREGQLREASFRNGQWLDLLIYGILSKEWQGTKV